MSAKSTAGSGETKTVKTRSPRRKAAPVQAEIPVTDDAQGLNEPKAASRRTGTRKAAASIETPAPAEAVKRGRGRPRKTPMPETAEEASAKKPRTAARATRKPASKPDAHPASEVQPVADAPVVKRGRGRPRKVVATPEVTETGNTPSSETAARKTTRAPRKKAAETVAVTPVPETGKPARTRAKHSKVSDASAEPGVETTPPVKSKRHSAQVKAASEATPTEKATKPVEGAEAESTLSSQENVAASDQTAQLPRFSDLGLSEPIMRAIKEMGYLHPTPIQAQAIPVALEKRDVLGVAQTGTGKTASFTLPMLERLTGSRARARMPRSLILEPTRELALQVADNIKLYGKHLKLNHALLIGGESMADQRAALNQGVDILIATPGRLIDLFDRGGLLLNQTSILVIDEADRMLDMGFIPDIERIVSFLPANRQTLLFSATMAPEIRKLADAFLNHPEEITVSRPSSVAQTIEEALLVVAEHDKRRVLRKLLRHENVQNAIVFCNRKRDVDVLYKSLHKHHFEVGHLHGDLPQSVRFKTLERFKNDELKILVCSDVAARGIDIGGLSHVFNFDLPFNAEDYVHRIGRTGRAGKTGHAYSLATPNQQNLAEAIETLTGKTILQPQIASIETLPWASPDDVQTPEQRDRKHHGGKKHKGRGNRREHDAAPPARPEQKAPPREVTPSQHSVVPTAPFEADTPRTGFGHETPAFMLLPRRNRTGRHEEQTGPVQYNTTP